MHVLLEGNSAKRLVPSLITRRHGAEPARRPASSPWYSEAPEQPAHGRGSLAFACSLLSVKAVMVPMQSTAAHGGAGAGDDHGDAGDREAGQRHPGSGRRGLIDGGPLLKEVRTSIICSLMPAFVKVFGCRPMMTVRRTSGPASANLQGRKPRDVGRGDASGAMGISSRAVCVRRLLNAFCGRDREGWRGLIE